MDTITLAAETFEPELAWIGSEIKDFDLKSINADETSERFQAIVGQYNMIEIVAYIVYDDDDLLKVKNTTYVVTNRQFSVGQVIDMGIEFSEMSAQTMNAYLTENEAQICALATVACYIGQPDMVKNLVNE